jgi:bacteriocin-like protein
MSESETKTDKTKIKELAVLMIQAAGNPQLSDDELEQIVGGLATVDGHKLDTAANGCPG